VLGVAGDHGTPSPAAAAMRAMADEIRDDDRKMCRQIGEHGASLLRDGMTVLTHCNTGALATAGIGTALGAIYVAHELGMRLEVLASETRPLLQGSRLTAWELARAGINVTVIAEGAAAALMRSGRVDCCLVGADRIARNGDVANKIGTYAHAVSADAHGVPFYVAAPGSSVDVAAPNGDAVPVEERAAEEILAAAGHPGGPAPEGGGTGIRAYNPAFDITPASLVSAIITETGLHRAPYHFT
jgi:methylthioribose-1-phosphate isomerase